MTADLRRLFDRDPTPDPCEPGVEVLEREDLLLWFRPSATRTPWTSGVLHHRWSASEAEHGIDEVLAFFAARDTSFSWHVPDDGQPTDLGERLERRAYIACSGHRRQFAVAYLDGRPIASARWLFDRRHPAIGFTGAETLPEYQNRGAYSTLVDYRATRGLERGCRYATILADVRTSAPILRKRGFVRVGTAAVCLSPGSRDSFSGRSRSSSS